MAEAAFDASASIPQVFQPAGANQAGQRDMRLPAFLRLFAHLCGFSGRQVEFMRVSCLAHRGARRVE